MNTIKSIGLVGLAISAMFAAQAFATTCPTAPVGGSATQGSPTCIATTSPDATQGGFAADLQSQLDARTKSGTPINVYDDQYTPSAHWEASVTGSTSRLLFEIAGNAGVNSFGIYNPSKPSQTFQIFSGPDGAGAPASLSYDGAGNYSLLSGSGTTSTTFTNNSGVFGYYLNTPTGFFYSDPALNNSADEAGNPYSNGMHHMVAFQGGGQTFCRDTAKTVCGPLLNDDYLLAWEDQAFLKSDLDYNDFVVLVESVKAVPEPGVLGMFGLGVLLLGGFATLRRRYTV